MKSIYVQAITEHIASGREVDTVLARTKTVMENRGHTSLYGEVLRAVVVALEQKELALTPIVTVAKIKDASSLEVSKVLALLDCKDAKPVFKIDQTIIGGALATLGHTHVDMSYKGALSKLYQAITI